jgi:hypothetical protein
MERSFNSILQILREGIPSLTLGELVVIHHELDVALNYLLNLCPISDTLDLRSVNIRKETIDYGNRHIEAD